MDDPVLEEEFRRFKKRDLFQTYFFKMACRAFGPPKSRVRLTVAPPMTNPTAPLRFEGREASVVLAAGSRSGPGLRGGGPEPADWVSDWKLLRRDLDLDGWLHSKPTLTEMESLVMDRRKIPAPPQLLQDTAKVQGGIQGEEILTGLQTIRMDSEAPSCWSSLEGPTGRAVEQFRRQCQREYLDSLVQCQRYKLPINQAALQKACLHPGDVGALKELALRAGISALKDKVEDDDEQTKKTRSRRRADPNAFWPGREDHVRLYSHVISKRPENVHFQLIDNTPVPSPGHWPVNQAGYYTSGDITRHKTYTL